MRRDGQQVSSADAAVGYPADRAVTFAGAARPWFDTEIARFVYVPVVDGEACWNQSEAVRPWMQASAALMYDADAALLP